MNQYLAPITPLDNLKVITNKSHRTLLEVSDNHYCLKPTATYMCNMTVVIWICLWSKRQKYKSDLNLGVCKSLNYNVNVTDDSLRELKMHTLVWSCFKKSHQYGPEWLACLDRVVSSFMMSWTILALPPWAWHLKWIFTWFNES